MIQINSGELLEFVRTKGSLSLETDKQRRRFTVRLNRDELEITVGSTGNVRTHERKWLQRVCERFSQTNSYHPTDYSELTVNASYTLAIIRAYLAESPALREEQILPTHVYERQFAAKIKKSSRDTAEARRNRLKNAPKHPAFVFAITRVYLRNSDVVIEVLSRADGSCEECKKPAPFARKADGTPYLEVHHRIPLTKRGEDTVENAIALCPNCHRKAHHG